LAGFEDERRGNRAGVTTQARTAYGFHCTPEENEGTIVGLDDVDYVCQADRVTEAGYWVGTDKSAITGIQSMG
jgi:hypothetical protein